MIPTDLNKFLESRYGYEIVGTIDLDIIIGLSRNTLYKLFRKWHKVEYKFNERIVLYSRKPIEIETLIHVQQCAKIVDISNFFILICNESINIDDLEKVRKHHSTDDCIFSTLIVKFDDTLPEVATNALLSLPDTFCFSPWAHMEISSQGEFKPCCVYKEPIRDQNNNPYNINTHSVHEVYNSDYLQKLRKQFLDGKKPSGCSECWEKEKINGMSNRNWIKAHLGIEAECLLVEEDSDSNLISLDIKLGNLCNFKCRICNPMSSSRIANEQVKHFETKLNLKDLNRKGQWVENEQIWKMFEHLGDQLVNIDFYGGEPFLIKQHEMFLDYLIKNNQAKKVRLHYNSNGSIYPQHLFEKWKHFRQIDISFSIDNINERFNLERGGNWHEVEKNLNEFLSSKLPNMILGIFPTVNVQNVYYLEELIDWFETKTFDSLIFNLLSSPSFMSITNMNQDLTTLVIDKLSQINQEKSLKYSVFSIIELIKQNKNSSESVDLLADYMLKLDNVRNQKFYQTHSEIASIIYKGN
jgi:organic radical activating enzyme